jgi:hypothetical protein
METTKETRKKRKITENEKEKKLSKIAQWWIDNPEGALTIIDLRAVLK